jgi:hypothetical protein
VTDRANWSTGRGKLEYRPGRAPPRAGHAPRTLQLGGRTVLAGDTPGAESQARIDTAQSSSEWPGRPAGNMSARISPIMGRDRRGSQRDRRSGDSHQLRLPARCGVPSSLTSSGRTARGIRCRPEQHRPIGGCEISRLTQGHRRAIHHPVLDSSPHSPHTCSLFRGSTCLGHIIRRKLDMPGP